MKSHDLKKALCQWTAMLALVVSGAVWAANGVDFSQSPEVSGTQEGAIRMPKEQERMPLNYVNQPPMIPHSVEGCGATCQNSRPSRGNPSNRTCSGVLVPEDYDCFG